MKSSKSLLRATREELAAAARSSASPEVLNGIFYVLWLPPPHPGNMQVQMLTPISRRICRLTALRHSPVRLLVVFALGDRLC
jgi:hypothetical protein